MQQNQCERRRIRAKTNDSSYEVGLTSTQGLNQPRPADLIKDLLRSEMQVSAQTTPACSADGRDGDLEYSSCNVGKASMPCSCSNA